jgi:hypothetical protein
VLNHQNASTSVASAEDEAAFYEPSAVLAGSGAVLADAGRASMMPLDVVRFET